MYDSHWNYNEEIDLDEQLGFIYCITEKASGKMYIGRKQFWNRRGREWYESDWRDYTGSSTELNRCIDESGKDSFNFDIIAVFNSKTGMSLGEATAIVCSGSLEEPTRFFNRAAPSIRGRLSISEQDSRGLRDIRQWIRGLND